MVELMIRVYHPVLLVLTVSLAWLGHYDSITKSTPKQYSNCPDIEIESS